MNENQGPKKNKRKTCAAEPSRAAERRKRFRAVCLLLCSFLWGVVLIRRLRTNCTRSDDPVLQHESVKDDVNRSRFYVTFSPPARHISNTVWRKNTARDLRRLLLLWPSGSAGSAQDSEPWRHDSAGLFCSLLFQSVMKQPNRFFWQESLRLCNMKTRRNKSCWFYSDRCCDFSLVLDWFWFWFFFFTDKHSWNHDYVTFVGVCSKCFLTFVFISSCSVTFLTFHPKNKSVCDFGTRSRSHPVILIIFLLIMQL